MPGPSCCIPGRAATPSPGCRHVSGPRELPEIPGFDPDTAAMTGDDLLGVVAGPIAWLQEVGMNGSAFFQVSDNLEAHASSAGSGSIGAPPRWAT